MLLYLDNHLSVGPHSQAAQHRAPRRASARSASTRIWRARSSSCTRSGVGGGYTQTDVTTFAEVITGWSIGGDGGRFAGRGARAASCSVPSCTSPGAKVVLGRRYADSGFGQGVAVLRDLARQPRDRAATSPPSWRATSSPTSRRPRRWSALARAFIAQRRRSADGLPRAASTAREAWAQPLAKYKTPTDYIVSSLSRAGAAGRGGPAGRSHRSSCWGSGSGSRGRRRAGRTAAPTGTALPR